MTNKSRIKNHTLGEVRYLTYYLIFPDGETWVDQTHVVGPADTFLTLTVFKDNIKILTDLRTKGSTHWRDRHKITHKLVIENTKRNRVWGKKGISV